MIKPLHPAARPTSDAHANTHGNAPANTWRTRTGERTGERGNMQANTRGSAAANALRPLHTPRSIRVYADDRGDPKAVRLKGRPPREVVQIRERWRIDDEWWRKPIARIYYDLVLDSGRSLVLYFDEIESKWLVHE